MPEEVRALVGAERAAGAAVARETPAKNEPRPTPAAAPTNAAIVAPPVGELKPGLGSASPEPSLVLSRDPALSGVVLIVRPRPPRPAAEASAEKSAERQPSTAEARPPPKAPVIVRSPERTVPSGTVG